MRPILRCALAAVVLTGCGVGPGALPATPGAVVAARPVVAQAASSQQASKPVMGDSVITPVAVAAPDPEIKPVAQAGADGIMAGTPKTPEELGQAFKVMRDGMKGTDGKAFDLFNMEVPANAVTENDPSLQPTPGLGFDVQAMPETTQDKADKEAYKWASDAKQIYVGWGYSGRWAPLSMFGLSRHVYYSVDKKRLLYVDYNFFRFTKARWESDDIVLKYAGKYITWVLSEPRGRYPYNGREAFNQATKYGYSYQNRPRATIKATLISPLIIGPKWIFFDGVDRPCLIVDAADGQVTTDGWVLDILKILFTFNP